MPAAEKQAPQRESAVCVKSLSASRTEPVRSAAPASDRTMTAMLTSPVWRILAPEILKKPVLPVKFLLPKVPVRPEEAGPPVPADFLQRR